MGLKIAIVSPNKWKYSETFIESHRKFLPFEILDLYGNYLPTHYRHGYNGDEKLIHDPSVLSFVSGQGKTLPADDVYTLLEKEGVQLILAEYGPSGVEMSTISERLRIPMVVHFHGYDAYRQDVLNHYGDKYVIMFNTATAIIVVSTHMKNQLMNLGCPEEKIYLLPYGINTGQFHSTGSSSAKKIWVTCGRLVEKKGHTYTIKAFAMALQQHSDARLIIIGDGSLMNTCKQLVKELGIMGSVEFIGSVEHKEVAKVFSTCSGFVQHSITANDGDREGLPLAILEAGAASLPVVTTLHAGIPDLIENSVNGWMVTEGDYQSMANRMIWVMDHPEDAKKMGDYLFEKIRKFHDLDSYINKLQSLISDSLNSYICE